MKMYTFTSMRVYSCINLYYSFINFYIFSDISEPAMENVKVKVKSRSSARLTVQAEDTQSEGETEDSHVVLFDFVMIKESK